MQPGETDDADRGAESLLGMRALAQDDVDECRGVATDFAGQPLETLRGPVGIALMARRHMFADRRVLAVRRRSCMCSHALAAKEDLHRARRDPRPHLLAEQLVRHGVIVLLNLDVIVEPDPAFLPLRESVWLRRQHLQHWPLQRLEQRSAARTEMPRYAIVKLN